MLSPKSSVKMKYFPHPKLKKLSASGKSVSFILSAEKIEAADEKT